MILPYLAILLLVVATVYAAIVGFREKSDAASPTWLFPQRTGRTARIMVGVATIAILLGVGVWIGAGAHSATRRASRFLIPEGYTGWVRVEFDVQGAAPLPVDAEQNVIKIPSDGVLKTSSLEQYGWAKDSYYSYSDAGGNVRPLADSGPDRMVWGKINGEAVGPAGKRKYEEFFVGTPQQFKDQRSALRTATP
jgi:hypothetical protein